MKPLRTCTKCGLQAHTEEDLALFQKHKTSKYGRSNICIKCNRAQSNKWCEENKEKTNKWRKENPEQAKKSRDKERAKNRYNVSLEEYEKCMATSDVCEHCGTTENLCYDHDHETMEFRGILCRCCNSALGKLGDTLEDIERMVQYLQKNKKDK